MQAGVRQLLGLAVSFVSLVGSIIICALPQWRVAKLSDSQMHEGLWKVCVTSSMHLTVCATYDSEHFLLSPDLAGVRVLIVIAIIAEVTGILLGAAASKFVNFVPDERKKSRMAMASGVLFLIAGSFVLAALCWFTITNIIEVHFNNDQSPDLPGLLGSHDSPGSVKWEPGASIYVGWITRVLLFLGGGLLCSSFLLRDRTD